MYGAAYSDNHSCSILTADPPSAIQPRPMTRGQGAAVFMSTGLRLGQWMRVVGLCSCSVQMNHGLWEAWWKDCALPQGFIRPGLPFLTAHISPTQPRLLQTQTHMASSNARFKEAFQSFGNSEICGHRDPRMVAMPSGGSAWVANRPMHDKVEAWLMGGQKQLVIPATVSADRQPSQIAHRRCATHLSHFFHCLWGNSDAGDLSQSSVQARHFVVGALAAVLTLQLLQQAAGDTHHFLVGELPSLDAATVSHGLLVPLALGVAEQLLHPGLPLCFQDPFTLLPREEKILLKMHPTLTVESSVGSDTLSSFTAVTGVSACPGADVAVPCDAPPSATLSPKADSAPSPSVWGRSEDVERAGAGAWTDKVMSADGPVAEGGGGSGAWDGVGARMGGGASPQADFLQRVGLRGDRLLSILLVRVLV
ncbi:hypothetical protein EYF80_032748 [Liparis tanakae]|uniref:Uncharacterized protein n=1 Tax=Liparis tanakae TaxID=230148 RepID=A0A4Z2GTU0_9TELE|nr:hypothetical protein EYF80_032748 [Liparis tanakae]